MSKYKITAPNKDYSGVGYGMVFVRGQSGTDNERIARMLQAKGYEVEGLDDDYPPMSLNVEALEKLDAAQLRDYAMAHKVDIGRATTDKGIIDKIIEAGAVLEKQPDTPEA